MNRKEAEVIVDKIISDLNGRRGCGIDSFDDEIQDEIRESWINITMIEPVKKPVRKTINVIDLADRNYSGSDNINIIIGDFVGSDSYDYIKMAYGSDEYPDQYFECTMYFLYNGIYYVADIKCTTYWNSNYSMRCNCIEDTEVLRIGTIEFNLFDIKLI